MLDFDTRIRTLNLPSPVTEIITKDLKQKNLKLYVKREDLINVEISGNKWRKLYLNLLQAKKENKSTILTFGGAFSNHIYATAAACNLFGFKSVGIIRGEMVDDQNSTLTFAQSKGMEIVRVSKVRYKNEKTEIANEYPNAFCIPEGGNSIEGREGMRYLAKELSNQFQNKKVTLVTAVGTGCTMAGLVQHLPNNFSVIGVNVLKNLSLDQSILDWINNPKTEYEINHGYHFGGYAKTTKELIDFANQFNNDFKVLLDPIYTAKSFYAIFEMINIDRFEEGDIIVALHTGGLQGIIPFNRLSPDDRQIRK